MHVNVEHGNRTSSDGELPSFINGRGGSSTDGVMCEGVPISVPAEWATEGADPKLTHEEALQLQNEYLATAISRNKADALPLNNDGAVVLRLTSTSREIKSALLNSPELAECCSRVVA